MIEDVYKIGLQKKSSKTSMIEDSIVPDKLKGINRVFCLAFDENNKFIRVDLNDFSEATQYQYLLRRNSANGSNFSPTSQITEIERTLDKKVISWFKEVTLLEKNEQNNPAKEIQEQLEGHRVEIIEQISQYFNKKEKYLITITIEDKFPYEIDWIFKAYERKIKNKIFGEDLHLGTCYLCRQKNVPIVPEYGVYKFYTKDKPGFIVGGFQESDFWRNCPVCVNCQPILNTAKQYIEENLKYRYYGLNYFIIPSTIGNPKGLKEILSILEGASSKKQNITDKNKDGFKLDNEDIIYELREENNINSFRLCFIQKSNSAERILLDIKDVYPIRFKQMYEAKEVIDKNYQNSLKYRNKEKQIVSFKFNFSFFREFLSKSDDKNTDHDLNKIFLGLTESIFNQNKVELHTILPHYMRKIRRILDSEDSGKLKFTVLKAVAGIQYLQLVGCMKLKKEVMMETRYEEFFQKYNCGLDTDIKRALVLIGTLVQKVMNIQYRELKSTPFSKNLKSLRLREDEIKGVVAQAVNKMQEYDCYSYQSKSIVEEISKLIFSSKPDWKLSIDEMNFYLVAGMALQKEIYGEEEEREEISDE